MGPEGAPAIWPSCETTGGAIELDCADAVVSPVRSTAKAAAEIKQARRITFVFYYITVRSAFLLLLVACAAGFLLGQIPPAQTSDAPLFALPYSPSLDTSSMDRAVDP